jgi:anti-anti-sigma factor
MKITTRQDGTVVVLELLGRLTGADAGRQLEDSLRLLGRIGTRTTVVNMEHVQEIDLEGLAALVSGYRELRAAGGEVRLAGVTANIGDMVVITRLVTTFSAFDSVRQAIDGAIPPSEEAVCQ